MFKQASWCTCNYCLCICTRLCIHTWYVWFKFLLCCTSKRAV